ncbi:MAG: polysaccharide deacetylase family protein [Acidobacteriia bacterium]|nr:polysaccharide deacetylase family protein [Terriglobia bacterium]
MGTLGQQRTALGSPVRVVENPIHLGANVRITPQARYYALAELSRRAGVPADFFRSWKVSMTREKTVIEISNGTSKFISFPHASATQLKNLAAGQFSYLLVPSMTYPDGLGAGVPNCVIPFVETTAARLSPLFHLENPNHLECTVDLPLSILLTLSRWEELLDTPRDAHGRFQAKNSIAASGGFFDRPIVDEYGLAFEHAMQLLYPSWKKTERKLRVKISHDADHIGIPFRWKTAVRHAVLSHAPLNSIRDVMSVLGRSDPSELKSIRDITLASIKHGLSSAVYWKAGPPGPTDSGYDPHHKKVRAMMDWLREMGAESGVHPGYATFRSPEKLRREVMVLKGVLGDQPIGGRQHYLRWCPETWIDWENCGLAYDSSVGFAETVGFRAGTCVPYRPWLFALNRQADLIEIPLLVMDRALIAYMGLPKDQALHEVMKLVTRCRAAGGVFTVLWHNNTFLESNYRETYLDLLKHLEGGDTYDWHSDSTPYSQQ